MTITRINHIKSHRIFQDFAWHNDLEDFDRYNLIYGWNGSGKRELADFYAFPNLARRLMESFLAFRYPASPNFLSQIQSSTFDAAKRTRLYRFLNAYSHREVIEEQQHDLTLLAEAPQILSDLLDFMAAEDKRHYDEMIKAITPPPEKAAS